jgi:hypothetical protein
MKYRTKRVQIRQKITVGLIIAFVLGLSSTVAVRAIAIGDEQLNEIKKQIEQPFIPPTLDEDGLWVTGDSVILGIRSQLDLVQNIGLINARVGRQASELLEEIRRDKEKMSEATVIFNLGNNNKLTEEQVSLIFEELADQPRIIVVNAAVPRSWLAENNALIKKYADLYSARLVDWESISANHPEYFAPDGVHLVPTGARAYVDAISALL